MANKAYYRLDRFSSGRLAHNFILGRIARLMLDISLMQQLK
ncbi:MAG: hypothetical protein SH868_07090 [Bythopirellula sp.]|nr:hypothetical protein [Bythopirellula sp.]